MMFSYYGIKQNVIYSGKWAFATPRNGICPTKWGLAHRGKPFARQNGASRVAGSHLPDKTGPRVAREAICPTKWGLALRGKPFARQNGALRPCGTPFARQNGASRIAGRHLPDKMGPRAPAKCQAPAHLLYFAIRITGLSSSSIFEAISFNGPRAKPRLISYISRLGSPDCLPRRSSKQYLSMGRGACRRLAPRRDRGLPNG